MPITAEYDPEARALYVRLGEAPVVSSVEVDDDFVVDRDVDAAPIGLEVLALPVTRQQIMSLGIRFGFLDFADQVWSEISRLQPSGPTRSGFAAFYTMRTIGYHSAAPVVVAGASSASLEVEAHEYALVG